MEPIAFKEWLRGEAMARGFARVGFASCEPFDKEGPRLERWFQEGSARHLPYLDPELMADPSKVMEGAQTALVGFFPYARPMAIPGRSPGNLKPEQDAEAHRPQGGPEGEGARTAPLKPKQEPEAHRPQGGPEGEGPRRSPLKVSRYLWGPDYHMILKPRLTRLLEAAQERWPGLAGRVCVDTAPLLERQMAARAGLGWQGKHTLLITGKDGSWGFLGVLLLSVELPPDQPFTSEHCGTCTACLDACPTRAISPFRVDPDRCLTTWTIETEAEPPPDIVEALKATRWAAGCDVCQEVCPWNRAPVWGDPALWGGESPLHTLPAQDLFLGASQWRKHTRRTALRRVRNRHWRRTVGLIIGREP